MCTVDKYENDTHAPVYYQYDTYVAEFHKKKENVHIDTKRTRNKCIRSAKTHFSFGQFIHEEYVSMDATTGTRCVRKKKKNKKILYNTMHLFLVRFVTERLTYIFIDYPDCEYIIILNTSIVIYDFWRLSVLRSSTPSMPIFGNRLRQKACLLTNTRMIHTHLFTINMILM
jgi:hypothetical protein